MSNPFTSPDPQAQDPRSAWSSQQPSAPQNPYEQVPPVQTTPQQPTWSQAAPEAQQAPYSQQAQPPYGQYTQQAYGQAPYGAPYAQQGEADQIRSNSTVILVLGILGLVVIGLLGSIPAWVWGNSTVKKAQAMGLPANMYQNANIGKVLGIIGTALWALALLAFIVFIIIAIVGFAATDQSTGGSVTTILAPFFG